MNKKAGILAVVLLLLGVNSITMPLSLADSADGSGFSLEVNPSPIVETLKPGEHKVIDLSIRNHNTVAEQLQLRLESFKANPDTGAISLDDKAPVQVSDWVKFETPTITLQAGEWYTEHIDVNTPAQVGFTYYFAVAISRQNPTVPAGKSEALNGSVAVFTLLNIDRPGAKSKMELTSIGASHNVYEYLPATINIKLKNTGNVLLHPSGDVYIQRTANSKTPISVLNVNPKGSYLLPGVARTLSVTWDDGFPHYVTSSPSANTPPVENLEWNWGKASFRIGRYVAQVVAVYNDGYSDQLVKGEVSFWVIPWKILLLFLAGIAILVVGLVAIIRFVIRRRPRKKNWR